MFVISHGKGQKVMRKIILIILLLTISAQANRVRVSFLFIHRSVGLTAVSGCLAPYYRNIRSVLDTMVVANGADTALIVFRSYDLNYVDGDTCLSDTVFYDQCDEVRNHYFSGYGWELEDREKVLDYPPNIDSPCLTNVFQFPNKENQSFWNVFKTHTIPVGPGRSITEKYDLVIVKAPYICWRTPTVARMESLKVYYQAIRDTIVNHPEINYCFAFGTPQSLISDGLDNFGGDTSQARLVYDAASWFAGGGFFTHANSGAYKNLWKWDSYRPLCETSPDSANRYCLKNDYWAGYENQSHLSADGAIAMQNSLIAFLWQATMDIMIQRAGPPQRPTRADIDRKIRDFRAGNASLQEVLSLIALYNGGK